MRGNHANALNRPAVIDANDHGDIAAVAIRGCGFQYGAVGLAIEAGAIDMMFAAPSSGSQR